MANKSALRWISQKAGGQKAKLFVLIICNALFSTLSVLFAFAIKEIIDGAVTGDKDRLVTYALVIFGIVVLQFIFRVVINGLTDHIRGRLEIQYKSHVFSQILKKKQEKVSGYHSGELMNRLTSDVSTVTDGVVSILPTVIAAVTRLVCAVVALVMLDWIFAVAFTVAGALVFLVVTLLREKLKSLHKMTQETDGKVRSYMQECLENLLAVKVFSVGGKVEKTATDLQEKTFKIKMRRRNYSVAGHAIYNFIFSAGYLFALIYGAALILNGTLTYGTLSAILQLVNNVQVPFASLSNILPKFYAMTASAERLMEIEDIENEDLSKTVDRDEVYSAMQNIVVENVDFTYDRDKVLKNANVTINKGDFVMIAGASGVGKSTLMKLMLGVYQPEKGSIYLNAGDGKLTLDASTRPLFSYVPQGNMLFSGTLKDNVTFVNTDASDQEIERALIISDAKGFVDGLPNGINTVVGEDGVGLSEGQIQRIAIARAVLCNAPIILLDEATSALDEETEKRVLTNFKGIDGVTLLIVSHRKAAESICNRVLRIKDKKFTE